MIKVVFLHCPDPNYADTQNYGAQFMPVWAYTLASHLDREKFDVTLHDCRFLKINEIVEADVYLVSGINQDYKELKRVCQRVKSIYENCKIVLGGPIAWSFDKAGDLAKLDFVDHIYIGDGENRIAALIQDVKESRADRVTRNVERFDLAKSRTMDISLMKDSLPQYYGAVVEVGRGCPFLCEFCDIRILPDNNRAHNKPKELVIEELNNVYDLGARQVLLACDNFIGDLKWANECVDAIINWQEQTGKKLSLYTWLTITLYRQDSLMQKMRHAGFDMLFIGVESFDSNSLLETAKVQNTSPESLERSIRTIQSYGFMVVGGLIFGFDSDTTDSFERTLNGLMESGMLSGDPSLLTALPGTPLYHRMRLAGRLRDVRYGLGGYKYQTNIKYLMSRDQMIAGYKSFVKKFSSGRYQFGRLEKFLTNLKTNNNFIPLNRSGYGNLNVFIKIVFKNPAALWQLFRRFALFSARPERLFWLVKGILLVLRSPMRAHLFGYLQFWFFAWSNAVLKYSKLSSKDFDIEGLNRKPLPNEILPDGYENYDYEEIPHQKSEAQRRSTTKQLLNVISSTEKEKS